MSRNAHQQACQKSSGEAYIKRISRYIPTRSKCIEQLQSQIFGTTEDNKTVDSVLIALLTERVNIIFSQRQMHAVASIDISGSISRHSELSGLFLSDAV